MATTTNYSWETPDDTDLVKDGAAAIRTLGSSIDTTTKALNPSTTLGDIEYRSSTANTNTRLGIGSTGQVLTVAGGVPSWATPAGGGGLNSFTLLNAGGTTLTGAQTITVSGISGQQAIMVRLSSGSSASTASRMYLRINGDTASNYTFAGVRHVAAANSSEASTDYGIPFGQMSDNGASAVTGIATILGTSSTSGFMEISSNGMGNTGGGTGQIGFSLHGFYSASAAVTSISVFSETGNFDGGTLFVYGMAA